MESPFSRYTNADPTLIDYFGTHPNQLGALQLATDRAEARSVSPNLLPCLQALNPEQAVQKRLKELSTKKWVAVLTGQQCGFLGGPLYTLYKALTAISVASQIERETGVMAQAIFWIQSEDHQLNEIDTAHYLRQDGQLSHINCPLAGPHNGPVANWAIGSSINYPLSVLESHLLTWPYTDEVLKVAREAYQPGSSVPISFQEFLSYLLQPHHLRHQLAFFDPRHPEARALCLPFFKKSLTNWRQLNVTLANTAEVLPTYNLESPVRLHPESPLLLYLSENPDETPADGFRSSSPRVRLTENSGKYYNPNSGTNYSLEELVEQLERNPHTFTTSALLRPIFQDSIFPTAAFVVGPGELAYLPQCRNLYGQFDIPAPLLIPRQRFSLIEPHTEKLLCDQHISPTLSEENLRVVLASRSSLVYSEDLAMLNQKLLGGLETLVLSVKSEFSDPQISDDRSIQDQWGKLSQELGEKSTKFLERYGDVLSQNARSRVGKIARLNQALAPLNQPQERVHSSVHYLSRYGTGFVKTLVDSLEPFDIANRREVITLNLTHHK